MSSLGDIQQVYSLLQQIEELLGRIDTKTDTTRTKINDTTIDAVLAQRLLNGTLSVVRQLSGDDNLNNFIQRTQQAIALVNQLRIISALLQAENPYLLALGVIGGVGTAVSMGDMIGSYM